MFSVTYTGTCRRPSWTARVCPTNWGKMVEARDQVLITLRSPLRFISSTFLRRRGVTKGPFFSERDIIFYLSKHLSKQPATLFFTTSAASDNKLVRELIAARLLAQGRLAPRCLGTRHTNWRAAFTTTMWMRTW